MRSRYAARSGLGSLRASGAAVAGLAAAASALARGRDGWAFGKCKVGVLAGSGDGGQSSGGRVGGEMRLLDSGHVVKVSEPRVAVAQWVGRME